MFVMRNAYVAALMLAGTNAQDLATSDVLSEDSFTSDGGMTHLKEVSRHLRGGSVSVEMIFDLNHRNLVGEYTSSFSVQWADSSGNLGQTYDVGGTKSKVVKEIGGVSQNTPGFRIKAKNKDALFIDKLEIKSGGAILNGLSFDRNNDGGYCIGKRTDRQDFKGKCWTEKTYQCIDFCADAQTMIVTNCGSATIQCRPSCPVLSNYPENDGEIETFMDAFKPCGHYANLRCPYEVISASVTYPGSGPGELEFIPYITQFDVGLHRTVNGLREEASDGQRNNFIGPPDKETCMEAIVQANDGRYDATLAGCAGRCGPGCKGAGWAKDCLKHDICVTYKNFMLNPTLTSSNVGENQPNGFCDDLDCGDEAAQTVMNCYSERRWRKDENILCDKQEFEENQKAFGRWSYAIRWVDGTCNKYVSWARGQGIPDNSQIRN